MAMPSAQRDMETSECQKRLKLLSQFQNVLVNTTSTSKAEQYSLKIDLNMPWQ